MERCPSRFRDIDSLRHCEFCATAAIRGDEDALGRIREGTISVGIDRNNGRLGSVNDAFGDIPEEKPVNPTSSVRRHDNTIDAGLLAVVDDRFVRITLENLRDNGNPVSLTR